MDLSKRARISELCERILAAAPIGSKLSAETVQNHDLETVVRYSITCPAIAGHPAEDWNYSAGLETEDALRLILKDLIGAYGAHDLSVLPASIMHWNLYDYRTAIMVAMSNIAEPCHTVDILEWLELKDRPVPRALLHEAVSSLHTDRVVRQDMDGKWMLA